MPVIECGFCPLLTPTALSSACTLLLPPLQLPNGARGCATRHRGHHHRAAAGAAVQLAAHLLGRAGRARRSLCHGRGAGKAGGAHGPSPTPAGDADMHCSCSVAEGFMPSALVLASACVSADAQLCGACMCRTCQPVDSTPHPGPTPAGNPGPAAGGLLHGARPPAVWLAAGHLARLLAQGLERVRGGRGPGRCSLALAGRQREHGVLCAWSALRSCSRAKPALGPPMPGPPRCPCSWGTYCRFALPSVAMLCCEWSTFEVRPAHAAPPAGATQTTAPRPFARRLLACPLSL